MIRLTQPLQIAAATAALALAACATTEPSAPAASVQRGHTAQEEANIANVVAFYEAAINEKNFDRARAYIGDDYIQHNPTAADGTEGLRAFIDFLNETAPESRSTIEAAYADGDYVILHVRSDRPAGTPGRAIVDIFRLDANGEVVEHWDIIQPIPSPDEAMNDNTMFYKDTPPRPAALTPAEEQENLRIAIDFYERALNEKHWPSVEELIGPVYIQHNLRAVDGPQGLKAHIDMIRADFPENRGDLQRAYVDGDRVILHMHTRRTPDQLGMAVADMFRVENGKVVEHWDVVQQIPEQAANDNGMFYDE
jgi:predicted SnoaL-like aldol condensation-catalyzing enzyme